MLKHWERETEKLKKLILTLGTIIEEQINNSMIALEKRDIKLADNVIEKDDEVDELEISVEEECLKILALYQPVAIDLRFVVTVLKMNNDLERMGDLAANNAKRAKYLARKKKTELIADLINLSKKVQVMVKKSLDSLINTDVKLAREVLAADDEIDNLNKELLDKTINETKRNPEFTKEYYSIRSISKNLERIGDSSTNIAEDVIYLCTGEIIRHRKDEFTKLEEEENE